MSGYDPWLIDKFCAPIGRFLDGSAYYEPSCWAHVMMIPVYAACAFILLFWVGSFIVFWWRYH